MSLVELEREIKELIVEALNLEDMTPEDIGSDERLFGAGLGLDSIDGLELGMAIRTRYGIMIEAASKDIREHFASVRNLAAFVSQQRKDESGQ